MAKLFYIDDNGEKAFITINAENPHVLVGRSKECNIKTKNNTVSRNHCQVIFTGGQFKLFDLGSSNGTYYKKQRVKEQILDDSEIFFCGNFEIKFELEDHERMPPEPELDISAEEIIELSTSDEEKIAIPVEEIMHRETVVPGDVKQPKTPIFETASYDDVVSQVRKEKEKPATA
ncbi:MAG: FHA domain-containing protein, partial [Deltaproteobacteria bacterium]|nr:FHA domain-containing protein [Deltaproteobacteria bacterium]